MQKAVQLFLKEKQFHPVVLEQGNYYVRLMEQEIAVIHVFRANELALKSWQHMNEERQRAASEILAWFRGSLSDSDNVGFVPIRFLDLVIVQDEVSEYLRNLADMIEGIWFISEQNRQIYVFERQSTKYFGIYEELQAYISQISWTHTSAGDARQMFTMLSPVTLVMVILNIMVYCLAAFYGDVYDAGYMYSIGAITFDSIFIKGEYYRLFSSMFLHFGLPHLVNNMISLICLGTMLERRMGSVRYGILYLSSGLLAGLTSVSVEYYQVMHLGEQSYSVAAGASGAIFGVIGGLIAVVLKQKWQSRRGQSEPQISMRSILFMAFVSLYQGFTTMGVDNAAHVGGMIFGFLLSFLLACKR